MKYLNTKIQFSFSILPLALCIFLILFSACDNGRGTSDEISSDTGSIAFTLNWEESANKSRVAALSPSRNVYVDNGIDTISAEVYNSSDTEVASGSWPYHDYEGIISGIPAGSGMRLIIEGFASDKVVCRGEKTGIPVSAGKTTSVGPVTMIALAPPTAASPYPIDGATDVAVNTIVTAIFSEAVDLASVNKSSFTLMDETTTVSGDVIYAPSTLTATFTPDSNLAYSTAYTATITTDVQDLSGNHVEQDYTWSFTTAPNTLPSATINSPLDDSIYAEDEGVGFSGSGSDPEDGPLSNDSLVWTSSMDDHQIGTGEFFIRDGLSIGIHTITLTVTDSAGATGSASISFSVKAIPYIVGSVNTPGSASGVYVSGDYAYVADWEGGLQVIDISKPTNPITVGYVDTLPGSAACVYASSTYAYVTYVADMYVTDEVDERGSGLQVIDIADPTNPAVVGSVNTLNYATGVYVSGAYAYVADRESGLQVIDISKPTNPTTVGGSVFRQDYYYRGVYVFGAYAYAYVTDLYNGLQVIDISEPTNPTFVGSVDKPGPAWGVHVSGNYAYVADEYSGLQVIDISEPTNPTFVSSVNTPGAYGVYVSGDYAYVAYVAYVDDMNELKGSSEINATAEKVSGLQVINISEPTNPTFDSSVNTPGSAYDVYVSGAYAYVADGESGLQVIRIYK